MGGAEGGGVNRVVEGLVRVFNRLNSIYRSDPPPRPLTVGSARALAAAAARARRRSRRHPPPDPFNLI
jgi:hypothetical protein